MNLFWRYCLEPILQEPGTLADHCIGYGPALQFISSTTT